MPKLGSVLGEHDWHCLRLAGRAMGSSPSSLHVPRELVESDSVSLEDHACETFVAMMVVSIDCLSTDLNAERVRLCGREPQLD